LPGSSGKPDRGPQAGRNPLFCMIFSIFFAVLGDEHPDPVV
jgi:hypothetical protein